MFNPRTLTAFATAVVVAGASMFLTASTASAATIDLFNDSDSTFRAEVTCTTCSVLVYTDGATNVALSTGTGDYDFDTAFGELFTNSFGSNEANEALWINDVLSTSFTASDLSKTEGTSDGVTYSTTATYVIIKVGKDPNYTILRNDSGGSFDFSWSGADSAGAGISHFTVGGLSPIPLPAAGFLLLGALGGLGLMRRRRKIA